MAASMRSGHMRVETPEHKTKEKMKRKTKYSPSKEDSSLNRPKKMKQYFSEVDFKGMLKDPSTALSGFEKFNESASAYPSVSDVDIVALYCKASQNAAEIFQVLDAGKRKSGELAVILNTIESILIRTADDLSKYKAVGEAITRRLLSENMPTIYSILDPTNSNIQIKTGLKLLVSMVMQGVPSAWDVLSNFDFSHRFVGRLINRRQAKVPVDVRTCLIQFLTAFFIVGDNAIIKQLMETLSNTKGFLKGIFSGLCADKCYVVRLLLSTLQEKVVKNPFITKTIKIRVFNAMALRDISTLYHWKGESGWKDKRNMPDPEDDQEDEVAQNAAEKDEVRELAHSFLLEICCSLKNGINFHDKTLGTSGKNMNHTLTNFLTSLSKAHLMPYKQDLVVEILRSCPDQLHWYLPSLKHSLSPRLSSAWQHCVKFLIKIYKAQSNIPAVLKSSETLPPSKLVAMVMGTVLPPKEIMSQIVTGIKRSRLNISHHCLEVVNAALNRSALILKFCDGNSDDIGVPSKDRKQFIAMFKESLKRNLPDVKEVLHMWNKLVHQEQLEQPAMEPEEEEEEDAETSFESVSLSTHISLVLRVLCAYQTVFPANFPDGAINFSSLMEGVQIAEEESSSDRGGENQYLHIYVLKLLANSDVRQLSWMKEKSKGQKKSTWFHLLRLLLRTTNPDILAVTRKLFVQLISQTGLFEQADEELYIWLQCLATGAEENQECLLAFMERMMAQVFSEPYRFTELISEVTLQSVKVDSMTNVAESSGRIDTAFISDLDMEVLWTDTTDSKLDVPSTQGQPRFPFTVLVPAAIEVYKAENNKAVDEFLDAVLMRVVSLQTDPGPLCFLLSHRSDKLVNMKVTRYIRHFMPGPLVISDDKHCISKDKQDFHDILQNTFEGISDGRESVMEMVDSLPLCDHSPAVKQILLYLQTISSRYAKEESTKWKIINKNLSFYFDLLMKVIDSIKSRSDFGSECTVQAGDDEHIQNILSDVQTNQETVTNICTMILTRPYILDMFFNCSDESLARGLSEELQQKISSLFTERVCTIIDMITPSTNLMNILSGYYSKVSKALDTECSTLSTTQTHAVKTLIPHVDHSAQVKLFEQILSQDLSQVLRSGEHVAPSLEVATFILEKLLTTSSPSHSLWKSLPNVVSKLCELVVHGSLESVEESVLTIIQQRPLYVTQTSKDLMWKFLGSLTDTRKKIVIIMLRESSAALLWLEQWYDKSETHDELDARVLASYLDLMKHSNSESKLLKDVKTAYWPSLSEELLEPNADMSPHRFCLLQKAVHFVKEKEKKKLIKQLSDLVESGRMLTREQIQMYCKLCHADSEAGAVSCLDLMRSLMMLTTSKDPQSQSLSQELVHTVKTRHSVIDGKHISKVKSFWGTFIKVILKHQFENAEALTLISDLAKTVYMEDKDEVAMDIDDYLTASDVYRMVLSHSRFLSVILKEKSTDVKDALVELMLTLVKLDQSCCHTAHISVLLGAYSASLSKTDQQILLLLKYYENSNAKMTEYRPYMWGPSSVEHYAGKKNTSTSLWKQPSMEQVVEQLNTQRLYESCLNFPLTRKLQTSDVVEPSDLKSKSDCYDPCFLLPLFSDLLAPENVVNCRNFIEKNCLAFTLSALSCHDANLRGAAYHVLTQFYRQMEGSKFIEHEQFSYMLECVRNSVEQPNGKLACIITIFLVKVSQLLLQPENHMYQIVNSFLLLKPSMDVMNVPEFYKLFNSSAQEFKRERGWMLSLLADGLRETADYRVFEKRYTFKLLLSYYDAATSDLSTQKQVLKILEAACMSKTVAVDLAKNHSILTWINGAIVTSDGEADRVELLTAITSRLWFTMLGRPETAASTSAADHCLPIMFTREALLTAWSLLTVFNNKTNVDIFHTFLKTIASILTHLQKSEKSHCVASAVTMETSALLLWHWYSICPEMTSTYSFMLDDLDMLTKTSSVKRVTTITNSQHAKKKSSDVSMETTLETCEDSEDNAMKMKDLEAECTNYVCEVLLRWDPLKLFENLGNNQLQDTLQVVAMVMKLVLQNLSEQIKKINKDFISTGENLTATGNNKKNKTNMKNVKHCLDWIKKTVSSPNCNHLRRFLLSDDVSIQAVVGYLLGLYSNTEAFEEEVSYEKTKLLNDIFVALVGEATRMDDPDVRICQLLSSRKYDGLLTDTIRERTANVEGDHDLAFIENCMSLLIQELWTGSALPRHAQACHAKLQTTSQVSDVTAASKQRTPRKKKSKH